MYCGACCAAEDEAKSTAVVSSFPAAQDAVLPEPPAATPLPEPPEPKDKDTPQESVQNPPLAEPPEEVPPKEIETPPPVPAAEGGDFYITLDKRECGKLGLDTLFRRTPPALKVSKIKPGPVSEWNAANPDKQLLPNSLILEVNGEKTDVTKMYALIASEQQLHFRVCNKP
uniref:PDZ domain-containing protein n=1 Tax=Zooxanthella nutricula TaxID=1333877 RepID=A0A7S2QEB8_9DINO